MMMRPSEGKRRTRSSLRDFAKRIASIDLNTPQACIRGAWLMPLLFGVWSMTRGTDASWDLYNYHLYNVHALLNGKLSIDFAPGGFQNFFNPVLDIPYYFGVLHLPGWLLSFLMGALHGLNFVLVLGICRKVLPDLPDKDIHRVPLLLAVAGCLTVNFLSELGNSMGDNMTALFCLASLSLIVHQQDRISTASRSSYAILMAAGVLVGAGMGLKLTNGIYAVAFCAGLLSLPGSAFRRLAVAFVFGIGVLCGLALMSGYWFYVMWHTFGNPLFPQFGSLFPNSLATSMSVADVKWIPQGFWRQILWPFIISWDSRNTGQVAVRQIIWALVYGLFILLAFKWLWRGRSLPSLNWPARYLLWVVVLGFALWTKLFGIYRYLVPIELIAPLVVFLLLRQLLPYLRARTAAIWLLGCAVMVVLLGGIKTWGYEPWGEQGVHIEAPPIADPARTTVVITEGDPPWSWLALGFPKEVSFTQIVGNFPRGPAFPKLVSEMTRYPERQTFAVFQGITDELKERSDRVNHIAAQIGLVNSGSGCALLKWVAQNTRLRASVIAATPSEAGLLCRVVLTGEEINIDAANKLEQEKAQLALQPYGLTLQAESCVTYSAGLGGGKRLYQYCPVLPLNVASRPSGQ